MPTLETPPNPPPLAPIDKPAEKPARIRSAHFGEMEQHELVKLLDSLEDDRSKSQFRESIYISIFLYLLVFWFLLYGPRLHTPRVVPIATHKTEDQLTSLAVPSDLRKFLNKNPTPPSPRPAPIPAPRPEPRPTPQPRVETKPVQPAPKPVPRATPAPTPTPAPVQPTPTPRPVTPTPVQPRAALPSAPSPRPAPANIPDAPAPSRNTGRPNFDTSGTAGDSVADAARNALRGGGGGVPGPPVGKAGIGTGYQILSDTQGFDFEPYIRRLLAIIRAAWIPLLPQETYPPLSKQGTTLIRFGISKDGTLLQPHLDGTSGDRAIDLAAWGSIQANGKFPPLPAGFPGPELDLRIQFEVNRQRRSGVE